MEAIERKLRIKEGETATNLEYSLETVACIGACGLAPCITINERVEGKMSPKKVSELFPKTSSDGEESQATVARQSAGSVGPTTQGNSLK